MKVTVFGIGYVGLVQAAVLAEVGHDVVCIDVDQAKVDNLEKERSEMAQQYPEQLWQDFVRGIKLK